MKKLRKELSRLRNKSPDKRNPTDLRRIMRFSTALKPFDAMPKKLRPSDKGGAHGR